MGGSRFYVNARRDGVWRQPNATNCLCLARQRKVRGESIRPVGQHPILFGEREELSLVLRIFNFVGNGQNFPGPRTPMRAIFLTVTYRAHPITSDSSLFGERESRRYGAEDPLFGYLRTYQSSIGTQVKPSGSGGSLSPYRIATICGTADLRTSCARVVSGARCGVSGA